MKSYSDLQNVCACVSLYTQIYTLKIIDFQSVQSYIFTYIESICILCVYIVYRYDLTLMVVLYHIMINIRGSKVARIKF